MYEQSVSFVVGHSLNEVMSKLQARINLSAFRAPDGFISFSGKETNGEYHLVHKDGKASRRVKMRLREVAGGVEVNLEVSPSLLGQLGIVLGCLLIILIGLVSLSKNMLLGSCVVAIGLAPFLLKRRAISNELTIIKLELMKLFGENGVHEYDIG
jgi:hypothetical protein